MYYNKFSSEFKDATNVLQGYYFNNGNLVNIEFLIKSIYPLILVKMHKTKYTIFCTLINSGFCLLVTNKYIQYRFEITEKTGRFLNMIKTIIVDGDYYLNSEKFIIECTNNRYKLIRNSLINF